MGSPRRWGHLPSLRQSRCICLIRLALRRRLRSGLRSLGGGRLRENPAVQEPGDAIHQIRGEGKKPVYGAGEGISRTHALVVVRVVIRRIGVVRPLPGSCRRTGALALIRRLGLGLNPIPLRRVSPLGSRNPLPSRGRRKGAVRAGILNVLGSCRRHRDQYQE